MELFFFHRGSKTSLFGLPKGWNTLHDLCPDCPMIYSVEKLILVAESQRQSADLS